MKLKKFLSMILAFSISFGIVALSNKCNSMEVTIIPPRYQCMRCGYIDGVKVKHSHNSRKMLIYCKNCHNKAFAEDTLKFKIFNPNTVKRTKKFGICLNSKPEKTHLGYISDFRINRKNNNITRSQLVNGIDKFEFYCYDCRRNMIIAPNPPKTSDN